MTIANNPASGARQLTRGFGVVAKAVMRDKAISPPARALYALLATYADDYGECFPSNKTLAEDMGTADSTVRRLQDELEERGVIRREPHYDEGGRRSSNRIHLIDVQIGERLPTGGRGVPPTGRQGVPPTGGRVTTPEGTTPEGTTPPPSGVVAPTAETEPAAPAAPPRRRKNPTTAAPDLFPLTDAMLDWGRERGAPSRQWLERETERFLNWARARDERYSNWTAAWRNWVLKDLPEVGVGPALLDESGYAPDDKRR